MFESNENTVSTMPQSVLPEPALPQDSVSQVVLPAPPAVGQPREGKLPCRPIRSKGALRAEAAKLSLEGHTSRGISRKLNVARQTVDRWLARQRKIWTDSVGESPDDLFTTALARLESIYREAMEAWRRSLGKKEITIEALGGDGKESRTLLRTESQSGQAALLGKAIQAAKEICTFKAKHLEGVKEAEARGREEVRRDLTGELGALPKIDKRILVDYLRQRKGPRREAHELAEILNRLPVDEYRQLCEQVEFNWDFDLPRR